MKKFNISVLGFAISLFVLTSCTSQDVMDKFIPKEEAKMAEDYLTKLRQRDFEYIKSKLSSEIESQATDEVLVQMADYFRGGELISTEIIGSRVHVHNGVWQGNFTFEYHFSEGWNLANAAFRKVYDRYEVIGLNVYRAEMSQKEFNAFKLSDKSLLHYLILITAICVPLFILVSTYYCIQTPIPKRKWLWIIFILSGIGAIQINWTTGQYAITLLSIYFLGGAATAAGPHAPWVVSASMPLGALLFWIKRKDYMHIDKGADNSLSPDNTDTNFIQEINNQTDDNNGNTKI